MATITKKNVKNLQQFGGTPYGNITGLPFHFETNASGYFLDSDTPAAAVGNGDVVRLGVLPAGFQLWDMQGLISDAFTASSTFKIGFAYVDGTDSTAVPQDDDFFCAATSAASTAVIRKTNVAAPVTLPKDAYLIITNAGAAQSAAGILDVMILGIATGTP